MAIVPSTTAEQNLATLFGVGAVEGPILSRYHVRGIPTVFVLDDQGIIRDNSRGTRGTSLDKIVDKLLKDFEATHAQK